VTTDKYTNLEIKWYCKHGKYLDRIAVSRDGNVYVIGDWAWNPSNPDRREVIEPEMSAAIEGA